MKRTFATVSQAVFDLFTSKWGWLLPAGILFKAIVGLKKHWKDIWAAIKIIAIVAWEKISGKFVEHFGWMLPGGAIHNALTRVKKKFDTTWNGIKAKFTVVSEFVKDLWDKHFGWMRPGGALFNSLDSLKTKWSKVWKAIGAAMKGPINAVIGGVNALLSAMNKISVGWEPKKLRGVTVVPGFEFKPFNFAQIPQLASGGIVKSPTLAMIGERGPEAVVPLGRGGGMGTTININILGATYGMDDFERKVTQAVADGVRRGGFSGILATS